jgi:mono/diheme cytochrome c family protein
VDLPIWQQELGGPRLIAAVAILHVFAAQLTVGSAVLLPALEAWAHRRGDAALLGWLRRHVAFLGLGVRVVGAVSGAGLWFTLMVVAPAAAAALARAAMWPFALDGLAFAVELGAGLVVVHGWDRLPARTHLAAGWIGAAAAVVSLILADSVLVFMLRSARGFGASGLVDLLSSPYVVPSALLRLAGSAGLAGLALLATAWREPDPLRARLARLGAAVAALGALVGPISAWMVSEVAGPEHLEVIQGEVRAATVGFQVAVMAALLAAAGLAALAWVAPRRPRLVSLPVVVVLSALALAVVGGAEHVREAVRLPWVFGSGTRGAMYASGLTPDEVALTREQGLLALAGFSQARRPGAALDAEARGAEIFRLACHACHTVSGPRSIRRIVDGLPPPAIAASLASLDRLRGRMPPFPGSPADANDLTYWLAGLDGVIEAAPPPLPPGDLVAAGRRVLEYRCLVCHRDIPLRRRVAGWSADFAYDAIGRLNKRVANMPAFAGDDTERRALAAYLAALGAGQVE